MLRLVSYNNCNHLSGNITTKVRIHGSPILTQVSCCSVVTFITDCKSWISLSCDYTALYQQFMNCGVAVKLASYIVDRQAHNKYNTTSGFHFQSTCTKTIVKWFCPIQSKSDCTLHFPQFKQSLRKPLDKMDNRRRDMEMVLVISQRSSAIQLTPKGDQTSLCLEQDSLVDDLLEANMKALVNCVCSFILNRALTYL